MFKTRRYLNAHRFTRFPFHHLTYIAKGRVFGNFCNAIYTKFKVFVVVQITLLEYSRWHLIESPDNELNLIYTWCIHAINTLVFIQRCGFFNCFYTQQFLNSTQNESSREELFKLF